MSVMYETDLQVIAEIAAGKDEENDHFLRSLAHHDDEVLDAMAQELNVTVGGAISCTDCGNCCNHLIVNITHEEITGLSKYLDMPEPELRDKYIEESLAGNCFINSVPCHFLADKKCSIYEGRFTECRDFPHLHKSGFRKRFLGTLLHYGSCPIIFNVVEVMKRRLGFVVS